MSQQDSVIIEIPTEAQMHEFGITLGRLLAEGDLVCLIGPLGAGKTTLTKGIGEGVGVIGTISSPTFLISRTHQTLSNGKFNHIDAYRLTLAAELDDLDIDFENAISVIEWGKGFTDGISDSILEITIDRDLETDLRTLSISGTGKFENITEFLGVK